MSSEQAVAQRLEESSEGKCFLKIDLKKTKENLRVDICFRCPLFKGKYSKTIGIRRERGA